MRSLSQRQHDSDREDVYTGCCFQNAYQLIGNELKKTVIPNKPILSLNVSHSTGNIWVALKQ